MITLDEFVILIIIGICREEILVDIEESLSLDNFLKFKSVKYLADFLIDLFIEQDVELNFFLYCNGKFLRNF